MKKAILAVLALATASAAIASETYDIDKGHSEAGFEIRHLVSKVHGRFNEFQGAIEVNQEKPETSSVSFVVKTASIDTANADRDKDLRSANFFEVDKFPEMSFKSSKIVPKDKEHFDVTGTLSLHGVTKPVTVAVSFLGFAKDPWGNERAGFDVTTSLNRKDFGIVWNKTLDNGSLFVGDEVQVRISIEAIKKKAAATH